MGWVLVGEVGGWCRLLGGDSGWWENLGIGVYTFSPPDGGTLGPPAGCTLGTTYGDAHGLIASGTLAFGRARVKGNTKLYNNVCINMP